MSERFELIKLIMYDYNTRFKKMSKQERKGLYKDYQQFLGRRTTHELREYAAVHFNYNYIEGDEVKKNENKTR